MVYNTVSFAAKLKNDIGQIDLLMHDEVLELPCSDHEKLEKLIARCKETGHRYGLHYPSYDSCDRVGFSATRDANKILRDMSDYYERYADAEYLVCHYPFHSYNLQLIDPVVLKDTIEGLNALCCNKRPLLIENISVVSNCCRASEYLNYLESAPQLSLCLDLGHAFLVEKEEPVRFMNLLGPRILAVHHYNTCNRGKLRGRHLPVLSERLGPDYMDMAQMDSMMAQLPSLRWIVDESEG